MFSMNQATMLLLRTITFFSALFFCTGGWFGQVGGCQVDISINGSTAFCAGDSRVLMATPGETYLWSTGETTQGIEVTQSGLYSVTVIDSTGCVASAGQSVAVLPALETAVVPNTSGPYCMGESVSLTAVGIPLVNQFQWSTGETSQSISVTQTGIYTVTVTNNVGCSASASLPMGFLPVPNSDIVANGSSMRIKDESALVAIGTEQNPIGLLGTVEAPGAWGGLYFNSTANVLNELDHVTVKYAGNPDFDGAIYM